MRYLCIFAQEIFGKDIQVSSNGVVIGTKGIHEYERDISSSALAEDPDLDLDTCNLSSFFGTRMLSSAHMLKTQLARTVCHVADVNLMQYYIDYGEVEGST